MDLLSPTTNQKIGTVVLTDVEDTRKAIAAAKRAFARYDEMDTDNWGIGGESITARRQGGQ